EVNGARPVLRGAALLLRRSDAAAWPVRGGNLIPAARDCKPNGLRSGSRSSCKGLDRTQEVGRGHHRAQRGDAVRPSPSPATSAALTSLFPAGRRRASTKGKRSVAETAA